MYTARRRQLSRVEKIRLSVLESHTSTTIDAHKA